MARIAVGNNVAEKIIMIASISTTCRGPKRLTMAQINEASSQPVGKIHNCRNTIAIY